MESHYETLAFKFAPDLYYLDTQDSFNNIYPEDFRGTYWRIVKSSVSWADVCIQYIIYFKEQHWVPSSLDGILKKLLAEGGKLPWNHPNDYAPIFLYFKNKHPVKAVFDVCHYEAVGMLDSFIGLPQDTKPKFRIKDFYRGLEPLEKGGEYTYLEENFVPNLLSQERLESWWEGFTSSGSIVEDARLIIRDKLLNPFQDISTFRDCESKLGFLFDLIFLSKEEHITKMRGVSEDTETLTSHIEAKIDDMGNLSPEDIKGVVAFANEHILDNSEVPNYLLRRFKKPYPI
jgi:hypothetical protein